MVNATNAALDKRPEAFDAIGVDVAHHIYLGAVVNPLMLVAQPHLADPLVGIVLVGVDRALWRDMLSNHAQQFFGTQLPRGVGDDAAFSLNKSDDRSLLEIIRTWAARLALVPRRALSALPPATEIGFVHLNLAAQRGRFLLEKLTNLFEHAPRGFVGDASFPLYLFCRDSAARRGHQVDGVEPRPERRTGLVEDCSGGGVNVMAALIARIRRTASHAMMFCHTLAQFAKDAFWVQEISEPFEARSVIREHPLEVFKGKPLHPWLLLFHGYRLA